MSRWFPERAVLRFGDAALGQGRLDAAIAAFDRDLEQRALPRGTRITCVVAGDSVRYRVVPWNDELTSPVQRQALAAHCFKDTYGDSARGWKVRLHPVHHGAAALACALDADLLDRLDASARSRGLKLISVQPSLMHAFNHAPVRVEGDAPFWYACVESLWTTALLMSPREPLHVKQMASAHLDLAVSLDREWFALGRDGPRCPVHIARPNADGWIRAEMTGIVPPGVALARAA